MHQFWVINVLAVLILVSNILCDTNSTVHYQKCQEYRAEDETLDENAKEPVVKVKILGNTLEGTLISPDTILVIGDVLNQEVTVHSFKVYLNDRDNNFFCPENFFIHDRFVVLKMNELIMKRYPRRRACLQIEVPKFSELHVVSYNGTDSLKLMTIGICAHLENNTCGFNYMFAFRSTLNNSLVLYIKYSQTVIVGSYFEYDVELAKIKLIDEENIKWIESVTWNNTISAVQQCGQVKLPLTPFIAHGMPTRPGEFPWHAAIFYKNNYICGGTIINTRAIVTTAMCVNNPFMTMVVESFSIVVGLHNIVNRDDQASVLNVQRVITHEGYDKTYFDNNIAVLRVVENIVYTNFVQPICIQNTLQQNAIGVVPGWGKHELGNNHGILQKGSLPVREFSLCRLVEDIRFRFSAMERNFCAGYENGTKICDNDLGGGLVFIEQDRWVLGGIVSLVKETSNSNNCNLTSFALFTNATYFYNWIVDKSS